MTEPLTCLGGDAEAKTVLGFTCTSCCASCHEDLAHGEVSEMMTIEVKGGYYHVCCDVYNAWDDAQNNKRLCDGGHSPAATWEGIK